MLHAHGNMPWRKRMGIPENKPTQQKLLQFPDSQGSPDVLITLRMSIFHLQDDKLIPTQVQQDVQMYWATIKDPAFCQNMASMKHFRNRIEKEQETEEQITRLNRRFR